MRLSDTSEILLDLPGVAASIRADARRIEATAEPKTQVLRFRLSEAQDAVEVIAKASGRKRVIYAVRSEALAAMLPMAWDRRCQGRALKLSQINAVCNEEWLYVGTSEQIRTRFRQHFICGTRCDGPYGMRLGCWELAVRADPELTFYWWTLGKADDDLRERAQLIEDRLWDRLRPRLGKRGGRG